MHTTQRPCCHQHWTFTQPRAWGNGLLQQQAVRLLAPPARARKGDVLLVAEGISKTHDGEKQLFGNLTFTVAAGNKLAIVGPNGAGKSTLLKIIAGQQQHDAGQISRNKGAKIGYLPQDDLMSELQRPGSNGSSSSSSSSSSNGSSSSEGGKGGDMTVLQAVLASENEMTRAVQAYQRALSVVPPESSHNPLLEAAIEGMATHNAWQVDSDARRMLEAVGLTDPNALVSSLSGGQRRRLSLATALLGSPDLLVLDEPTNHMDAAMITWMEEEIRNSQDMAVIMVSHDRAFMESCCNQLLELDHGGFTTLHPFGGTGSYDDFREARAARRAAQASAAADARTVLRREAEWMARQPKARSTKAKARVDAFSVLQEKARDTPPPDTKPDFGRAAMLRLGNKAVELVGVSATAPNGRQLLSNLSYEFVPGSRVGIAGPNGVGKSSLLDIIVGLRQPQSGVVEVGETAVIGYFQQHPPPVPEGLRLVDYIRDVAEKRKARRGESGLTGPVDLPEVLLEKLGFPRKTQFQKVESLSGGERRRLHLAAVLAATPNVLLLDEPTNDLDLNTVEVLEDMLASYRGLLLVVSHDRAFMEGTTDDLLVLPGDGRVTRFQGSYSAYLEQQARQAAAAAAARDQQRAAARAQQEKQGSNAAAGSSSKQAASSQNGSSKAASSSSSSSSSGAAKESSSSSSNKAAKPSKKRTLGLFERQEYEKLGTDLAALESSQAALNDKLMVLTSRGAPLPDIEAASLALAELQAEYEAKEERWLVLADIAGDI